METKFKRNDVVEILEGFNFEGKRGKVSNADSAGVEIILEGEHEERWWPIDQVGLIGENGILIDDDPEVFNEFTNLGLIDVDELNRVIGYNKKFEKDWEKNVSKRKSTMNEVEKYLLIDPNTHNIVVNEGNHKQLTEVRKLRWDKKYNRYSKQGSIRILNIYIPTVKTIFLLRCYSKGGGTGNIPDELIDSIIEMVNEICRLYDYDIGGNTKMSTKFDFGKKLNSVEEWAVARGYIKTEEDFKLLSDKRKEDLGDIYEGYLRLTGCIKIELSKIKKNKDGVKEIVGHYMGYFTETYEENMQRYINESGIFNGLDNDKVTAITESVTTDNEVNYYNLFCESGQLPIKTKNNLIIAVESSNRQPHFHIFRSEEDKKNWKNGIALNMTEESYYEFDDYNKDSLTAGEVKSIMEFLRSENPIDTNKYMWESLIDTWNCKNPENKAFMLDLPDYDKELPSI